MPNEDNGEDTKIDINHSKSNNSSDLESNNTVTSPDKKRRPAMSIRRGNGNGPKRRSITDIKRDSDTNKRNAGKPTFDGKNRLSTRRLNSTKTNMIAKIIGVLAVLIIGFLILGSVTHKASLELVTRSYELTASGPVTLIEGEDYDRKTLSVNKTMVVPATDSQEVSDFAEGLLTVVNTTEAPQRLIATTRFVGSNGVTYRVPVAITVPAANGDKPGELSDVRVVADKPGEAANGSVTGKIDLPGLAGTELEGKMHATAQTDFSGGFEGVRPVADADDVADAVAALEDELETEFMDLAIAQLSAGDLLLEFASTPEYSNSEKSATGDESVTVTVTASAEAYVAVSEVFLQALARDNNVSGAPDDTDGFQITNIGSFTFDIDSESDDELSADINGAIVISPVLDTDAIAEALLGLSSEGVKSVLSESAGIEDFNLDIGPFWKTKVPTNVEKVSVTVANQDSGRGAAAPATDSQQELVDDGDSDDVSRVELADEESDSEASIDEE